MEENPIQFFDGVWGTSIKSSISLDEENENENESINFVGFQSNCDNDSRENEESNQRGETYKTEGNKTLAFNSFSDKTLSESNETFNKKEITKKPEKNDTPPAGIPPSTLEIKVEPSEQEEKNVSMSKKRNRNPKQILCSSKNVSTSKKKDN